MRKKKVLDSFNAQKMVWANIKKDRVVFKTAKIGYYLSQSVKVYLFPDLKSDFYGSLSPFCKAFIQTAEEGKKYRS